MTKKPTESVPTTPTRPDGEPPATSRPGEVSAFLKAARNIAPQSGGGVRGRLLFALDATMSRQPTWDAACHIQADMFREADRVGGLDVQLVYFRGFGECRASKWVANAAALADLMTGIQVRGGYTQLSKILKHAIAETDRKRVSALIYVGDCLEEAVDHVCDLAGQLGLRGVPAFMFHEGHDGNARQAFQEIARLTGGAYCPFDSASAAQLRALLSAVAVYAAGGHKALADYGKREGRDVAGLIAQLKT